MAVFKSTFVQPPNWKNNFRLETPGLTWLSRPIFPGVCGFTQGSASVCVWSADWFCWFPAKMCAFPAPTQSVRRWEVDGPPRRAWEAVSPAAALWENESFWVSSGSPDPLRGTCQVPGPSDAGELVVPPLQVKCPPWSRPSTGSGGCEQSPGAQQSRSFQ